MTRGEDCLEICLLASCGELWKGDAEEDLICDRIDVLSLILGGSSEDGRQEGESKCAEKLHLG